MPPLQPEPEALTLPQESKPHSAPRTRIVMLFAFVILAGIATGYFLSREGAAANKAGQPITTKTEVGVKDQKTFRDCAQGTLEANDPEDKRSEGSHKLVRDGGPSQTLYLISSVLALDEYIGKKIEVCGETLNSKKVPWFMDVGKLKLI